MRPDKEFEVNLVPGLLRTRDVRAMLGQEFAETAFVSLMVLGRPGERSSVGLVELGQLLGGRGERRGLRCPRCRRVGPQLFTDGEGGFGCGTCLGRRTRRQSDRTRQDWTRLGGLEEDRLLRAVRRPARETKAERVQRYVDELLADDRARTANVVARTDSAIEAVSARRSW